MPDLYAITTVWNPTGYESRYRLYREFSRRLEDSGAILYTVELATNDQEFAVTDANNPRHIQLRGAHVLWYKENLVNIAIARLPRNWRCVAWLDADLQMIRRDWVAQTVAELGRHPFVQLFSHVVELGPEFETLRVQAGFAYRFANGDSGADALHAPPGGAWAARRREFEAVGGLIDWSVMGSNDYFMAHGLVGAITPESTRAPGSTYAAMLLDWQARCSRHVGGDFGYVRNTIAHFWHGSRKDRGYNERWRVLVEHGFDPTTDLTRDADGLLGLSNDKPLLRQAMRNYFISRNEDSAEL